MLTRITDSQKSATKNAIRKIAWHTAQGKGQRAKDAQAHCKRLGIDWKAPYCATGETKPLNQGD